MEILTRYTIGDSIPKVIHQTYPCKIKLPAEIQKNIRQMCALNPSWEHRLYDDRDIESYIFTHYGENILSYYRRINYSYGAARADFFRYLLMYAEGGVYLDIKSSLTQSLDKIINSEDSYILSKWENPKLWAVHPELKHCDRGEYQQWHIITVSGHPFLREVIEQVIKNIQQYNLRIFYFGIGKKATLRCTGPVVYTQVIDKIKYSHNFREVNITRDYGFKYSIYNNSEHIYIFTKHYSRIRSPLIKPHDLKDLFFVIIFYISRYAKRIIRKLWSGYTRFRQKIGGIVVLE